MVIKKYEQEMHGKPNKIIKEMLRLNKYISSL